MIKRIDRILSQNKRETLATFTLKGDKVTTKYDDAEFGVLLERDGIFLSTDSGPVRLWPKDGQRFFDGLEQAYGNSSFLDVVSGDG